MLGPDAYISPALYATKREHGRVVPTWNYSACTCAARCASSTTSTGCASSSARSPTTTSRAATTRGRSRTPPTKYVAGQLRAIVGVEMVVESVEAKAKLSQNRSEEDVAGVIEGLTGTPR